MKYLATIKKIYDSEDFEDKYDDPDDTFDEDLVMELFIEDISHSNFKIEIEPLEVE